MEHSEKVGTLAAALAKAQGAMRGAAKDSANPFFKSKYADLAACWDACRKPLADNGLSVIQTLRSTFDDQGEHLFVDTMLAHESGEWVKETCEAPISKPDAQGYGSASTYFRRYGLSAIVGIAPEDDDGEAAVGRKEGVEVAPQRTRRTKAVSAAKEPIPPPVGDPPRFVAIAREALNSLCIHIADVTGKPIGHVRGEQWARVQSEFEVTKMDAIDEKTASAIVDWCVQEQEASANV